MFDKASVKKGMSREPKDTKRSKKKEMKESSILLRVTEKC